MIPPIDIRQLPVPAQKIVSDGAPPKLQLMAAKGVIPGVAPADMLAVLVLLSQSGAPEIASQARQTLSALPEPLLKGALSGQLHGAVLYALAQYYVDRQEVLERIIRLPSLPIEAVEHLCEHGGEMTVELVSTNEERMLANPQLIGLVYMNERSRMSTANRLIELAVRNGVECPGIPAWKEVAQAIKGELIAEPSPEPLPEDEFFWEQHELAEKLSDDAVEDAFFEDEEGEEHLHDRFRPLYQRLADMTVAEKIRRAMLGSKEERLMLIREPNKVVATSAARSPLLTEPEVAQVTRNRGVVEDVLRIIGNTPEWMKSYQVKVNLVNNPKCPVAIASRLITQLRESDLRRVARSKNVSSAIQLAARRHLDRRKN